MKGNVKILQQFQDNFQILFQGRKHDFGWGKGLCLKHQQIFKIVFYSIPIDYNDWLKRVDTQLMESKKT